MIFQSQSRVSAFQSVSSVSVSAAVSMTQTQRTVHAGFMLGSRLPAPGHPSLKAEGFVAAFVTCRMTVVTTQFSTTIHHFSVSQSRSQTKNPVQTLAERGRKHPASAMLFEQTTTYRVTTTVSLLYFGFVCWQSGASGQPPSLTRPPTPTSAQTPKQLEAKPAAPATKPAAPASPPPELRSTGVTLKPVEPSKKPDPSNWLDLQGVTPKKARYDLWGMENNNKWLPVEYSLKTSPETRHKVTPQTLAPDGLSFTAVNEDNKVESVPLDKVKSFTVL